MESSRDQYKRSWNGRNRGRKKQKESRKKRIRKTNKKKRKIVEVKKVAKEWEIWDEEEEAARSEAEAKKMVSKKFHQWIKVFGKRQSERIPTKKA